MTVSNSSNKAGPYLTNGVTTQFAFDKKVLASGDIKVYRTDLTTLQEDLLTVGYSVALINGGADGATVTISPALPAGYKITLVREVNYLQDDFDPSPNSTYYADVVEGAMDKRVMQIQQIKEQLDRAVKIPISADGVSTDLPSPRAGYVVGSTDGASFENLELVDVGQAIAGNWTVDRFLSGVGFTAGVSTSVTLSKAPASAESILVFFDGVAQHRATYTILGTTLNLTSPVPLGVAAIEVRIPTSLAVGAPSDGSVTAVKLADGNVTTAKLADGAVTNAKMANVTALTLRGNATGVAAAPQDLTAAQARTLLSLTAVDMTRDTASPNNVIPVHALAASGAEADIDLALQPKGTGALIMGGGAGGGGNKRGTNAADFQRYRSAADQVAGASYSAILGGTENRIQSGGQGSAVIAGALNDVNHTRVLTHGYQAKSRQVNSRVHGVFNTDINAAGAAQLDETVVYVKTTDATVTALASVPMATDDEAMTLTAEVVGYQQGGTNNAAGYRVFACAKRGTGAASVALVSTATVDAKENNAAWDCTVTVDTSTGLLKVNVTGAAATTILWVATVRVTSVRRA